MHKVMFESVPDYIGNSSRDMCLMTNHSFFYSRNLKQVQKKTRIEENFNFAWSGEEQPRQTKKKLTLEGHKTKTISS